MSFRWLKAISVFAKCLLLFVTSISAQGKYMARHTEVALRMIGHQVLLNAGDSSSLVLPIEKEKDRYRIRFASEFEFHPDELVSTVKSVARESGMSEDYIVEVEQCESGSVVYSFEINESVHDSIVPCGERAQPRSCYSLLFTFTGPGQADAGEQSSGLDEGGSNKSYLTYAIVLLVSLVPVGAIVFVWRKKHRNAKTPDLIPLGKYQYDKQKSTLFLEGERTVLTSKEADLLLLLYNAVNMTVEREELLNKVWGDQGSYVGRTLDVFVSKLRKKLAADPDVNIVNVRGVGYKLVMEIQERRD